MRAIFGLGGVGLLAVVCCAGLPLIVAAGLSAAVLAWIGGLAVGLVALVLAVTVVVVRARKRACAVPPESPSTEARR